MGGTPTQALETRYEAVPRLHDYWVMGGNSRVGERLIAWRPIESSSWNNMLFLAEDSLINHTPD